MQATEQRVTRSAAKRVGGPPTHVQLDDRSKLVLQVKCHVFTLPLEVRHMIYKLALFSSQRDEHIEITWGCRIPQWLNSSRQIRKEAIVFFYGTAKFHFTVPDYRTTLEDTRRNTYAGLCKRWLTSRAFGDSKLVRHIGLEVGLLNARRSFPMIWTRVTACIAYAYISQMISGLRLDIKVDNSTDVFDAQLGLPQIIQEQVPRFGFWRFCELSSEDRRAIEDAIKRDAVSTE